MVRGVRGAITVENNDSGEIIAATERLLREMQKENGYEPKDIAQIIITVTDDLTAAFPARALRNMEGYKFVPVMCSREIPVPNSLEKCIRVMLTLNTNKTQAEIKHVFLERAISLRPDLVLDMEENNR